MKSFLKKCVLPLALAAAALSVSTAHAAPDAALQGKNVVLVHGAFADGSSWNKVIPILEAKGLHVVSVQNPLSSLGDDVSATRRVIEQQNGPVVLVGHSWGGFVITQAGVDPKVKALVYVAALAADKGQSVNDRLKGLPAPSYASELRKDTGGFLTLSDKGISRDFANGLPAAQVRLIAATQGPWFAGSLDEKLTDAAWHNKPSWFVVTGRDRMIDPKLQTTMAKEIGATIVNVDTGHLAMLVKPDQVAAAIIAAAKKAR